MADPRLLEILRILHTHGAEFIVVGGMAAVIGGAPIVTRDVDVLRSRSSANIDRLLAALSELDAVFRDDERRLRPNASHLAGPGHLLLQTLHGPLDILGTIEDDTTYEDVLRESYRVELGGFEVRTLSLERLLVVKRKLGRPKDVLMALQIEATLDELRKNQGRE
jgi:predicted nucleotidyltransferase